MYDNYSNKSLINQFLKCFFTSSTSPEKRDLIVFLFFWFTDLNQIKSNKMATAK